MFKEEQIHFPQSEVRTMLVPVSTGCPYNKCTFCTMYKGDSYNEVPLQDIEYELLNGDPYTDRVFLTGADPLAVGFERMCKILKLICTYFPYCGCTASYASVKTIRKYRAEELTELHKAGLGLLYIGFETGNDEVLKFVKKGHTVEQAVEAGKKLNEAKIPFNSIIMYGLAGKGKCIENAIQTADMLNQFDSNKIITMNLTIFATTELSEMTKNGSFIPAGSDEKLEEIKTLLENLKMQKSTEFDTSHATNIIKMIGYLPGEKERMLKHIENLRK